MKYDIKSLTLEEKLHLLTGKDSWRLETANGKLPEVFLSDGPHGLRMHEIKDNVVGPVIPATAMPNLSLLANTWDPSLAYLDGATIADDCIEKGADVLLAPGVNIKRTPLCGRNFEYLSEDPYLAGVLAKAYIEGVQDKGVGTSLKHFCANNREYGRLSQTSEIDDRALHEIYLRPFEIALEAKPWTVMCSYNPINGIYASENKKLLKDILRDKFGFDGLIVSDWGAVHNAAKAVKANLDLRMPYHPEAYDDLRKAYDDGVLTEAEIDARVEKVLELIEKTQNGIKKVDTTKEERHAAAVKIAREGMVLLKNEDGILPLSGGKLVVTGPFAKTPALGGGGSAFVTAAHTPTPLADELGARLGERIHIFPNETFINDGARMDYMKNTLQQAYHADTVLLCVGTGKTVESEGYDRFSLRLSPIQEDLILNTAKVNPNVVVVLHASSAVDMTPWIDHVKAVLVVGFAGEAAHEATADILCGITSPCGKLAETYPLSLEDTPTGEARGNGFYERYSEGVLVGYRWFDTKEKEVLFPFGHGLSYADFSYSDLAIEKRSETDYEVGFTITNTSSVDAKEIAELYVRDVFSMVERPEKELKGFVKVALAAGESKRVSIKLDARAFAYYNTSLDAWYVENGDFEILVGASSRDIRLCERLSISLPKAEQYSVSFGSVLGSIE